MLFIWSNITCMNTISHRLLCSITIGITHTHTDPNHAWHTYLRAHIHTLHTYVNTIGRSNPFARRRGEADPKARDDFSLKEWFGSCTPVWTCRVCCQTTSIKPDKTTDHLFWSFDATYLLCSFIGFLIKIIYMDRNFKFNILLESPQLT